MIRDMCAVELSRGTFAAAIDKGFKIVTINIEKKTLSET